MIRRNVTTWRELGFCLWCMSCAPHNSTAAASPTADFPTPWEGGVGSTPPTGTVAVNPEPSTAPVAEAPSLDEPTSSAVAAMDDRHALVIGNSKYLTTPLPNPANDARLMAKELQSVGFNVRLVIDGTRDQMIKAINDFQFELSHHSQGVGLFYYAGHGIQVDGSNYLVPVNAHLMRAEDTEVEAVNLNLVLARMDSSNSRFKFVILDACRNNPFPGVGRTIGRGLAFVSAPTGTLIAYATAPGDVAADGESGHSPFTSALARELHRPGEEIGNTLKSVRAAVQTATRGKQTPWESTSIVGDFYFVEK